MKDKKVIITGGTGLVGKELSKKLTSLGYHVCHLSRSKGNDYTTYQWNPSKGEIAPNALQDAHAIIHLAGAGVADHRWTKSYKKEIYESRIGATKLLFQEIKKHQIPLHKFVSASAIGIYGNDTTYSVKEDDSAASNFLAQVCVDWERESSRINELNIPTCIIRVGVVLSSKGGFIKEVGKPIQYYAGTVLGSGKQMLSWIHINDLVNLFAAAVTRDSMKGIYNGVSPNPVSFHEITHKLAQRMNKPILLPNVPEIALKIMMGEMYSMLIANQHVSAQKILNEGFEFQYPDIDSALANLVP
jgi:uncharacterized protein (TIGR01777 family)